AQNASHGHWTLEQVDEQLKQIMINIFKSVDETCQEYNLGNNYLAGVNITSFVKIADAMLHQGIV
ncbi:MAG: NADP-specific glutamate dehydrogenase, partial [Lactobacillales bacterium]|nr:NADP-specific glutamate dehydrogenase [Lactobacillales bacterium]